MRKAILTSFAALFIVVGSAAAKDLLVPSEYKTIQAAIDDANDSDTVIVADGTYTGKGNCDIDFKGKAITVMSETGPGKCIIDCQSDGRGFYFHSSEDANSVLDGFTITNGYATHGGGIFCSNASPKIIGCTISYNCARHTGGVYSTENSSPTISDCTITDNTSKVGAGGLGFFRSSVPPKVNNCIIAGNNSTLSGPGGIWCHLSSPAITDCVIANNTGRGHAGGIQCTDSSPVITNCIISGNSSSAQPGGIECKNSSPTIRNCIISTNTAGLGSALFCHSTSSPYIINSTICDNSSKSGAAIYCSFSSLFVTNSIIWGNSPQAIVAKRPFVLRVSFSNIQGGWKGEENIDADPLFVMDGPDATIGTLTEPPKYNPETNRTTLPCATAPFTQQQLVGRFIAFSTPERQALITSNTIDTLDVIGDVSKYITVGDYLHVVDYRLQSSSPCINAGTPEKSPKVDIEGTARNGAPDIGAYEMAD